MGNPRRIRLRAMSKLTEAWESEVRRAVTRGSVVVGEARMRESLGSMLGAPTLAALVLVLERAEGWERGGDGVFRYALPGGHIAFHPDTAELEIVARVSAEVMVTGEATVLIEGLVEGPSIVEAEGAGTYYDDGWGGTTAEEAFDRARQADEEEALDRARQADEEAAEAASKEAEQRAEAAFALASAAREGEMRREAAEALEAVGVEGGIVFNRVLAEAYRDAILAYARSRHAVNLRSSEEGDVLDLEFQTAGLTPGQAEGAQARFRYNTGTGEVDIFEVTGSGWGPQSSDYAEHLDRTAAEIAGMAEKDADIYEVTAAAYSPSGSEVRVGAVATGGPAERIAQGDESLLVGRGHRDLGGVPARRYLMARCPDRVPVGRVFSLLVSITQSRAAGSGGLRPFSVPAEGRDVLLVVHAAGMQLLGDPRQAVRVPSSGDSQPVMFELRAETPGPGPVSITAWLGGSYLGELMIEVTAEHGRPTGPHREVLAEISADSVDGAVSLVVRYDPRQAAYRFEFRDEDNPSEVTSLLAYDPAPLVEHLIADMDNLARRRTGYSAAQTRDYLMNAGARLWNQLIPAQLREQFWDRQHRIRQLTILDDRDAVPWELLYPMDPGHDSGFLVEQFPVTRAVFGWLPSRTLNLRPARLVLPESSLTEARDEIDIIRRLLDPEQPSGDIISALTPLQDMIADGNFGLLHFACHNTYDPARGSSITLDNVQFTLTHMATAVINKVLARNAPTVFMNACRSAGLSPTYNQLDGWAREFLRAGAGAFIGTLWAVSDSAAREFAREFYTQLQAGSSFGTAVTLGRQAAASQPDDPTWLAYTAYGNPRATISRRTDSAGEAP